MSGKVGARPYDLVAPGERDYFDRFGNGLVVVLPAQRPGPGGWGRGGPPHGGAWIHLGEDGRIRAFTGKVEVGQGTATALSLLVAEELGVPLASVELTLGDTDLCPWDMGTFGSRSMPDAGEHLRLTAAGARTLLVDLAAAKWGEPAAGLRLQGGKVVSGRAPGERTVAIAELVRGRRQVETVPPNAKPRDPASWETAGRPVVNLRGRDIVTGRLRYTSDLDRPGLYHGKMLYPPAYGARLKRVDLTRAQAMPGVVALHEGDFVAVAAPDLRGATAALRAVQAEWESPEPQPTEAEIVDYLRAHPGEGEDSWDVVHHATGAVDPAFESASVSVGATYRAAYIAHVPLETHAALAEWDGDRVTVSVGAQTPFRIRDAVSDALGIPPTQVHVIVPPTGSGFGGKHAGELAAGAARLAKACGHPVKVVFTREEEFTDAYFRPLAVVEARAAADAAGNLSAWQFEILNAGSAAARTPYRIPNQKIDTRSAESPLPQASYRALAATANNFARESLVDELTARLGEDPVRFRLRQLADERLATVLRAVAERAGWEGWKKPAGQGQGVAVGLEKGGRVATVVRVQVGEDRSLRVLHVVTGYEAGAIVHPLNLRGQVEGATIMALGGALFEAIHFDRGKVLNPRLSEYRVPRFHDVPPIEVVLVDRRDLPSQGGGETPLIAVAPAIANAIFHAVGVRCRSLPLVPDGTVG